MKAVKNSFILLLIALAALFAGHSIRLWRASKNHPISQPEKSGEKNPGPQNTPAKKSPLSKNSSVLAAKLEQDLSMSSGVTRWLYWLEALEQSTPRDFPALWQLAKKNPELQKLLATRWSENYPREFFDFLISYSRTSEENPWETLSTLFSAWAKSDLPGFVAALENAPEFPLRNSWLRDAATGAIFNNDVETGLRLMSQLHIENHTPNMKSVPKWAAADPLHAAQFAMEHPAGYGTKNVLEIIGSEWAKTDPAAALKFAQANGGQFRPTLANAVLAQWTEQNIQEAAAWLAQTDPASRNDLSAEFVKTWAKRDLTQALDWAENNLTGLNLTRAAAEAVRGFAEKDPAAAAAFVKEMPPSAARAEAARAVARKWFPDSMNEKAPSKEAVEWISQLDKESGQRAVSEVTWSWSAGDPKTMADYLVTANNELISDWIYNTLARSLVRKNPSQAMQWTERLPEKKALEVGNEAFSEWRRAQPQAALDWLTALPKEDPRRNKYFENAITEWSKDNQHAEQLAQFTALDPKAAEKILKKQ